MFLGRADADRDHRPQLEVLGLVPAGAHVVAERPGHDREDDVVDRPPVRVLDPLELSEVGADERQPAVRPDVDVEGRARRRHPGLEHLPGRADAAQHPARAAQGRADAADDLLRAGEALADRVAQQVEVGRLRPRGPLRRTQRWRWRVLLEVEQDRGYVNPGYAVDERVVALADDREAVALEALDQPQLPERLGAVELLGEDPRGEVAQLLLGARRRQRGLTDVVVEVEVRVVDPDRAALAEGDEAELLTEAGDEVQARLDVVAELFVARRRAIEEDHRGDVHVGAASLQVEECGVESGQPIRAHRRIFSRSVRHVAL